ncbi:hypothetical protein SDC9_108188 [bioreactor metagenome]|uniref:Uncharacterized protein n=1 Tax=bioreactor metagenome TaxID=1076179 RepID=A0A645B7A7_9ZZZZ
MNVADHVDQDREQNKNFHHIIDKKLQTCPYSCLDIETGKREQKPDPVIEPAHPQNLVLQKIQHHTHTQPPFGPMEPLSSCTEF